MIRTTYIISEKCVTYYIPFVDYNLFKGVQMSMSADVTHTHTHHTYIGICIIDTVWFFYSPSLFRFVNYPVYMRQGYSFKAENFTAVFFIIIAGFTTYNETED